MAKSAPMTKAAVARIQSATAKINNGKVSKGDFVGRAQRAAEHTMHQKKETMAKSGGCTPPNGPSTTGNPSGGSRGNCASRGK